MKIELEDSAPATFLDLLRLRAREQPDRRAYIFLSDGEAAEATLTYGELDRQARAIGAALAHAAGERALLLYPPGLEFVAAFFGCLYAGVVAVPAYPPDPTRLAQSLPRLRAIVQDARPALILTVSPILAFAEALAASEPELAAPRWLATDELARASGDDWRRPPAVGAGTLAFLQYTSGSTAEPKGVMVSHGNLMHNSAHICRMGEHTVASVYVCWLPMYHDMGLIGGVLQPLYAGMLGVLLSPAAFLVRPRRWLRAIANYGGTTSPFPNFALDLCVRRVAAVDRAALDLSGWRLACNGAEPIRAESLDRFTEAFGPSGFRPEAHYPAYGLAEATLIVSGGAIDEPPRRLSVDRAALEAGRVVAVSADAPGARPLVGCGRSLPDQRIVIVDPERGTLRADHEVGEIWVRGPSVARGYWDRPEQTAEAFGARLEGDADPFLRTGDLGFLSGGELFVVGRLKDLLILSGRNHHPQDIELTVERSHAAVRPGGVAAFAVEVEGAERPVVVAEVDPAASPDEVSRAIRDAVGARHDLALHALRLVAPRTIPKTSSGKLQRRACRDAFLRGALAELG